MKIQGCTFQRSSTPKAFYSKEWADIAEWAKKAQESMLSLLRRLEDVPDERLVYGMTGRLGADAAVRRSRKR